MFIEEDSVTAKSAVTEILKISLLQDCPFEGPTKSNLAVDSCLLKKEESLCNCTQTGEVKILVKKITDFENQQQKLTKNKNPLLAKEDEKSELTINNEMSHLHCQKTNCPSENCQNDVCTCQTMDDCVEPNLVRHHNCHEKCPIRQINGNVVDKFVFDCQDGINRGAICKDIEEMSDFLVRVCEKRQLRRASLQEPQIVPEDYQINEMSDPYGSILQQGDHIMDTFHNLLTDNGNLSVRISFSYCAKLLAILLTLNTIFFSKIIIWDSFLQHLF